MMNPGDEPERKTPFPGPNAQRRNQQYQFTPEELRVLRECNKESFYTRCLPIGTGLGGLTYFGVQSGYLKPSPRFGAVPKVCMAVVLGYFIGKFSYHTKCAEKFMALPNSKVGQALKARRLGIPEHGDDQLDSPYSVSPFSSIPDSYTDIESPNQSFDYGSRPAPDELDDSFRPSLDNPIRLHEEEMPPEQKHITTYEELRKKNREEYEQKRVPGYRPSQPPSATLNPPISTSRQTEFSDEYNKPSGSVPKNKYGDVWG